MKQEKTRDIPICYVQALHHNPDGQNPEENIRTHKIRRVKKSV